MQRLLSGALIALAMLIAGGPAQAQTMGYADAMSILVKSCGPDIEKYCKNVNLGNGRIESCLADNAADVSDTCKADYVAAYLALQARFAAQEAVPQLCAADVNRLCPRVTRGKGFTLQCLLNKTRLSDRCSQAITDAGYR
ncbi:MAG: cysteine rich repeat-containing protein [Pseudomonadota bacterium]